jgi:hypothetical protein
MIYKPKSANSRKAFWLLLIGVVVWAGFKLGAGWAAVAGLLGAFVEVVAGRLARGDTTRQRRYATGAFAVASLGVAMVGLVLLVTTLGHSQETGALALFLGGVYAVSFALQLWGIAVGAPPSRADEAYVKTLRTWFRQRSREGHDYARTARERLR